MDYFKTYASNTLAGGGNQNFFCPEHEKEEKTGRIFYKLHSGGRYDYSFLFSNIIDSTFSDGAVSHKNLICHSWQLKSLSVSIVKNQNQGRVLQDAVFLPVLFGGKPEKRVMPGEFFHSDPVSLSADKGDYLCLQISFSGTMIPYLEDNMIPCYIQEGEDWLKSNRMPFPAMVGCNRKPLFRMGFLGDSITLGVGTENDSYDWWCAQAAEMMNPEISFWNMGIGGGRAEDGGSDGAWLYKAKQTEGVVLCFGVNDLMHGLSAESIKENLQRIVRRLKENGVSVLLQTVPPFGYTGDVIERWHDVNRYIREELRFLCDSFFDAAKVMAKSEEEPHMAMYGGHPNAEGCALWAEAISPVLKAFIERK